MPIPAASEIVPPESVWKTMPSAASWADVQPRYEMVIARLVASSTGLP